MHLKDVNNGEFYDKLFKHIERVEGKLIPGKGAPTPEEVDEHFEIRTGAKEDSPYRYYWRGINIATATVRSTWNGPLFNSEFYHGEPGKPSLTAV